MLYAKALKYVTDFIQKNWLCEEEKKSGWKTKIYDYADGNLNKLLSRPNCGIRVAEVSFQCNIIGGGVSGSSYMQVDMPYGIAVCGQVERCLLALVENWEKEEIEDEFERLKYLNKWLINHAKGE